ncbi:MAG: tryptophan 2,3-dioxygenase [Flavobacteriales bacterium]|nr:tryptophan 2,3-dioxygenase [Flavobacteriales bacterium]HCA82906.1 tryptophan 2,3-dioxygenase [Flavobacteriales bacterium]HRE74248.1 tryptophan 2,3-dioxygenase family protein [Flavobacteriales bacterium]HRE95758.1 tryptophan 2,3-dioxygenase family protein [Flavobacteriales bacterium]HRJ36355.1 tryptophan 2,3-dioxygenase family protein [Flavobacteriales bacterium]
MSRPPVHYSDYLQLEKILDAQHPESDKEKVEAHDEMLFIIIHQAYELWFKQILHEIDSMAAIMGKPVVNDNSPELQTVVHRMERVVTILKVLVHQIDILETMTPLDFLDFRDLLRPASGFQSWQFKITEAKLGLKFQHRYGQEYYVSQLRPEQVKLIKDIEQQPTLLELVNKWLERMPFFEDDTLWKNYKKHFPEEDGQHIFWSDFKNIYASTLVDGEKSNLAHFYEMFSDNAEGTRELSPKACRSALFIMLYRGYPMLQTPYRLLNNLLEVDEQLSTWRFRHVNMVHRMIGSRTGTGGSTGKEYLKNAMDKHYIFKEVSALTSFLIERRKLPHLSQEMDKRLGFHH